MKRLVPVIVAFLLIFPKIAIAEAVTLADQVIHTGKNYLGTPYQYGAPAGQTRSFDCSSFTQFIFGQHGISLPRTSVGQYQLGQPVERTKLMKGDLIFFDTDFDGDVNHLGVYVGNGEFLHVSTSIGVTISKFAGNPYWEPRYVGGKRVISTTTVANKPLAEPIKYVVRNGDSLWIISQKTGTSISNIKSWNHLTSDMIYAGQHLIVGYQHTVAAGDTLFLIARKYNVTISQLKTWNQRTSDTIYVGEKLRIFYS